MLGGEKEGREPPPPTVSARSSLLVLRRVGICGRGRLGRTSLDDVLPPSRGEGGGEAYRLSYWGGTGER